jgi:hypothetical protein
MKDYEQCEICFHVFDSIDHIPLYLIECLHILCKSCFEKFKETKLACPFCKSIVNYNEIKPCRILIRQIDIAQSTNEINNEKEPVSISDKVLQLNEDQLNAISFLVEGIESCESKINVAYNKNHLENIFDTKHNCSIYEEKKISQILYDNSFGLNGKAGVGKTVVISYLCQILHEKKINFVLISPTHTASTVLSENLSKIGLNATVKTLASLLRRRDYDGANLNLLNETDYVKTITNYSESAILMYDVILFDESSMISISDLLDLENRIKTDLDFNFGTKIPCLIFSGDYRQLAPIIIDQPSKINERDILGYISKHVLCNTKKSFKLDKHIRTDSNALNELFSTIGSEIENFIFTNKTCNEKDQKCITSTNDYELSLVNYGSFLDLYTNSNHSESVIILNKQEAIKLYISLLKSDHIPNKTFWIHYNNVFHRNTLDLVHEIRSKYIYELSSKNQLPERNFVPGDYLNFISKIKYQSWCGLSKVLSSIDIKNQSYKYMYESEINEITNLIPGTKVKILDIFIRKHKISQIFLNFEDACLYNKHELINVQHFILNTRKNKPVFLFSIPNLEIKLGTYNKTNKKQENISLLQDNKIILKIDSISYSDYLKNYKNQLSNLCIENLFSFSYVGSSHTVQGDGFDTIFIGEDNILRKNYKKLTTFSSLYTSMTRAKKKVIIVRE